MRLTIGRWPKPTDGWLNLDNSLAVRGRRQSVLLLGLRLAGVPMTSWLDLVLTAERRLGGRRDAMITESNH
jgi:hypothetical protein